MKISRGLLSALALIPLEIATGQINDSEALAKILEDLAKAARMQANAQPPKSV